MRYLFWIAELFAISQPRSATVRRVAYFSVASVKLCSNW